MNMEDVIRLIKQTNEDFSEAIESGELSFEQEEDKEFANFEYFLQAFASNVIAEEREACAKECEALDAYLKIKETRTATGAECANAIRSKDKE